MGLKYKISILALLSFTLLRCGNPSENPPPVDEQNVKSGQMNLMVYSASAPSGLQVNDHEKININSKNSATLEAICSTVTGPSLMICSTSDNKILQSQGENITFTSGNILDPNTLKMTRSDGSDVSDTNLKSISTSSVTTDPNDSVGAMNEALLAAIKSYLNTPVICQSTGTFTDANIDTANENLAFAEGGSSAQEVAALSVACLYSLKIKKDVAAISAVSSTLTEASLGTNLFSVDTQAWFKVYSSTDFSSIVLKNAAQQKLVDDATTASALAAAQTASTELTTLQDDELQLQKAASIAASASLTQSLEAVSNLSVAQLSALLFPSSSATTASTKSTSEKTTRDLALKDLTTLPAFNAQATLVSFVPTAMQVNLSSSIPAVVTATTSQISQVSSALPVLGTISTEPDAIAAAKNKITDIQSKGATAATDISNQVATKVTAEALSAVADYKTAANLEKLNKAKEVAAKATEAVRNSSKKITDNLATAQKVLTAATAALSLLNFALSAAQLSGASTVAALSSARQGIGNTIVGTPENTAANNAANAAEAAAVSAQAGLAKANAAVALGNLLVSTANAAITELQKKQAETLAQLGKMEDLSKTLPTQ